MVTLKSKVMVYCWDSNTHRKTHILGGHSHRVHFASLNPDGNCVVTGSGDETMRFWNIFSNANK